MPRLQFHEEECVVCHGVQFFAMEYEATDYEVGLSGGWSATLLEAQDAETTWSDTDRCHCTFTDKEREAMERALAKDYQGAKGMIRLEINLGSADYIHMGDVSQGNALYKQYHLVLLHNEEEVGVTGADVSFVDLAFLILNTLHPGLLTKDQIRKINGEA